MSNQQHTPGPWIVATDSVTILQVTELNDAQKPFPVVVDCASGHVNMPFDEAKSNARLIAAAPELLEAAQEMADLLENILRIGALKSNDLIIAESIRNVLPIHRAAIAKATGS